MAHRPLPIVATVVALTLGALAPASWAQEKAKSIPFSAAKIIIELNASAQDVGIQIFLDTGDTWKTLRAFDPTGRKVFEAFAQASVGALGVSEFFFESAEPTLEELPLDEFFELFPEGEYRFSGETVEGLRLAGKARLTHVIPAGPEVIEPREGSVQDPAETEIAWRPAADPPGSKITGYQVIVGGGTPAREFNIVVSPTTTRVEVPEGFLKPRTEYNFEVLAIEAGGNQTITEGSFSTL